MTDFGTRLAALRQAAGLTQNALAVRSGLSAASVLRLERGDYSPTWSTVLKLAKALKRKPGAFGLSA